MAGVKRRKSDDQDVLKAKSQSGSSKKQKTKAASNATHKIIIGLDFGTTYTGVSFVTTDKKTMEDISIITTWPGTVETSSKTPTRIAYKEENRNLQKNKWGFEVDSRHTSCSWTKLLLDKSATHGDFDDPSLAKLTNGGMMRLPDFRDAPGVCEDFLRELYIHVAERLQKHYTEATFDITPMECWVTLPAIWSEQAKDATLQAAKKAGFGARPDDEVYTIAEPEAAAIATLKKFSDVKALNPVKPGEHILICDCGGGTVDITTYTIVEVSPQLKFDELCVGIGGKCGSTYIDRNFHALMSTRFGAFFDGLPHSQKGPGSLFMNSFEMIKRSFGMDHDLGTRDVHPLAMKTVDSDFYDEEEATVKLSYADMQLIFDPVMRKIVKLVDQQVQDARLKKAARIDRIVLVGGFGDSAYLHREMKRYCETHGNIMLVCPEHPQAAIVRGAALRGLESIAPRIKRARKHYGFVVSMPFREGIDPESSSEYDEFDGHKLCTSRMSWIFDKGEAILRDTEKKFDLTYQITRGKAVKQKIDFYSSDDDVPREHFNDKAKLVGSITTKFPANFDFGASLKSRYNARLGKTSYRFSFELQVVFGNMGDNLSFKTLVNGKVEGTAEMDFGHSS